MFQREIRLKSNIKSSFNPDEERMPNMNKPKLHFLFALVAMLSFAILPPQAEATTVKAKPVSAAKQEKERLVLMPLRIPEEDKNLAGAMETALVKGLQQKYDVFSGEQVAQKARQIFLKESRNTAHAECDETRCMQNIAEAFQAELIATANVTQQDGSYFLALSIQNIFDNKVMYSESLPCEKCSAVQVVEKLKELSGTVAAATQTSISLPNMPVVVAAVPVYASAAQTKDRELQKEIDAKLNASTDETAKNLVMVSIPGKNYEIGKYDVTQAQWRAVMGDKRKPSDNCDTCPMDNLNWYDTQKFIEKLNSASGRQYRLPTEEEWEYACYAGSQTKYCGGNDVDAVAWYQLKNDNIYGPLHPVGQKQPNGYGLYDMSGNAWQWLQDPSDEHGSSVHVLRGGDSLHHSKAYVRASAREEKGITEVASFRLARTLP